MRDSVTDVGHRHNLTRRFAKALASAATVGVLALGAWSFADSPTVAGGETRTISLYQIHTKESLTVTYMENGRYVPSAMKKVNYLLRDWRRNETITIDPKTLDLLWEMHADLGSQSPIHVVCGYRSPRTNAFLKRIGRKVATKSQHMKGKAIDFYFPDVPTVKIRNSALVRKVGGVGYYRSSGGPTGFLHVDSGNVRHWGPAISNSQMAAVVREGSKTVGMRLKRNGTSAATSNEHSSGNLLSLITGKKKSSEPSLSEPSLPQLESAYVADEDELADLSADAAGGSLYGANAEKPASGELAALAQSAAADSLADDGSAIIKNGYPILKPRFKPRLVMELAALSQEMANGTMILPASAPPEGQTWQKPSQVADNLGAVEAAETLIEETVSEQTSNTDAKTSFAAELRNGTAEEAPLFEPTFATLSTSDSGFLSRLLMSADAMLRRNGTPPALDAEVPDIMPRAAVLGPDGSGTVVEEQHSAEGKGDALFVVREGKGGLPPMKLRLTARAQDLSQLEQ